MLKAAALILSLQVLTTTASSVTNSDQVPRGPGRISQVVEKRRERLSCWGVVIHLANWRFRKFIKPNQIVIREGKHGHELRDIMSWRVEQNGRRLALKFKPGKGDFGSGNTVEVQVARSALVGHIESDSLWFQWAIHTDVFPRLTKES
jgi:hypothetical protein